MPPAPATEVKINEWLTEGFELFRRHAGILLLASLIVVALSAVTLGVLSGPLTMGLILIILNLYKGQGQPPKAGDVFQGFRLFLPAFLFFLVWGTAITLVFLVLNLIPLLGQLLALAVFFGASAVLMFGPFLIADQGMGFWEATQASWTRVRSNWWPFVGFGAICAVIGQIGMIFCGVGFIVTLPIMLCMEAVAYMEIYQGVATEKAAPAFQAPTESQIAPEFETQLKRDQPKVWEVDEEDLDGDGPRLDGVEDLNPGQKKDR
jgi:hypothetical protein